jgi:protein SCO1/2
MLIYFGFTYCPDVCPTTLIKMADIIDRLGEDTEKINSIFITVDPERDTTDIISDYVSAFHEDIIGLTGTENEIDKVAEDWGVYYEKEALEGEEEYTVNHLDIIFLANANGEFVDYFPPKIQSVLIVEKIKNIINK